MGQQDGGDFGDYLDTVTDDSGGSGGGTGSQDDPPLPLPPTDDGGAKEDSGDNADDKSAAYKDLGEAAATRDFQQAHGDGWEYDADAMSNQITRLQHIRDNKLHKMTQLADDLIDVTPPAREPVTKDFIDVANRLGNSHKTQLDNYIDYLTAYIDTLKKIDKAYQDEDEQAAQDLLSKDI